MPACACLLSTAQPPHVCRLQEVCRVANWLRSVGVKKGDSVAIYMPMVCELPIAMVSPVALGTHAALPAPIHTA